MMQFCYLGHYYITLSVHYITLSVHRNHLLLPITYIAWQGWKHRKQIEI